MLSILPRENLENIFGRLPPESLNMLRQMCKLMHSVSNPLLFEFIVKRQRQKVRTFFFNIYDRLKMELNTSQVPPWVKPVYIFDMPSKRTGERDPWARAYIHSTRLSTALLECSGGKDNVSLMKKMGIDTTDLTGNVIFINVMNVRGLHTTHPIDIWLHHNRIMFRGVEYPFPQDPYVFVRNALDRVFPEGFPTQ